MGRLHVEESMIIEAPADRIYRLLADYRDGHPRVLPPAYFAGLEVEQGGIGAGTVVRVRARFMGQETAYRLFVTEPTPGRVLMEADPALGVVTTFTVDPLDGGRRATVSIATEWAPRPGARWAIEGRIVALAARRIYRAELKQLAEVVQTPVGAAGMAG
jgi:hypothetical protein